MLSLIFEVINAAKLVWVITKEWKTGPELVGRAHETVDKVKVILETVIRKDLMRSSIYRGVADEL